VGELLLQLVDLLLLLGELLGETCVLLLELGVGLLQQFVDLLALFQLVAELLGGDCLFDDVGSFHP